MKDQFVHFHDLGLIDYKEACDVQEKFFNELINLKTENSKATASEQHLIFCEHPAVVTLGKSGNSENLLLSEPLLKMKGIGFYHTNRGGDITFHGPGQVVGYPILDLNNFFTDIGKYLRLLEEVIIATLAEYGIKGQRLEKATGVWLDAHDAAKARKICAMGVRMSHWVTMHGFALNVDTDLSYFNYIIPCGLSGKQVTSMEKELGTKPDISDVKQLLKRNFQRLFGVELKSISEIVR